VPIINLITHIRFANGAVAELSLELQRLGISRPLIVSDPGVVKAGRVERACENLQGTPTAAYFDTPENPTEAAVSSALGVYRAQKCDGLVAIGGGSSIDLAKAVALLATHDGALMDYDVTTSGSENVGPIAPVIAIPTTAGTGTEVGIGAVIVLDSGHKGIIDSTHLIPAGVICDPEMTYSLPPSITAATGIDALSHCLEAYLSNIDNPPLEAIALDGAARIAGNIVLATSEGGNANARSEMMMGALEGGMSMMMELGAAHAMANYVGHITQSAHGHAIAVLLGPALAFNETAAPEKIARIREVLGAAPGADICLHIQELCKRLKLPTRISELGACRENLDDISKLCEKSVFNKTNPRAGTSEEYAALLRSCY